MLNTANAYTHMYIHTHAYTLTHLTTVANEEFDLKMYLKVTSTSYST